MRIADFCHHFLAEFAYCTVDLNEYEMWTRFYVGKNEFHNVDIILDRPITRFFVNTTNQFVLVYSSKDFASDALHSSFLLDMLQHVHPRMKLMLYYCGACQIISNRTLYSWEIDHDQKRIYFLDLSSYQQKNHRKEVHPNND